MWKLAKEDLIALVELPSTQFGRVDGAPKRDFALLVMANNTFGDMWKMVDNPQTRQHLEFLKGYKK